MYAANTPAEMRSPEQRAEYDKFAPLRAEVLAADVLLLGVPMYNYTIPSTLKSWLDHILVPEFRADAATGTGLLAGKRVHVVATRGGSYAPGTPRETWDHQEPLLRQYFIGLGLEGTTTFVQAEMTLSYVKDELRQFQHIADSSREQAYKALHELATVS